MTDQWEPVIEDGVPIPPHARRKGYTDAVSRLEVGQYVLMPSSQRDVLQVVFTAKNRLGRIFTTRKVDATHTRVWRIA